MIYIYCIECILLIPGSFCSGYGAISLQWGQHDGVPYPQHRKLSGVINHREVVHGTATSPTQTRLWPAGRIHDGRLKLLTLPLCCAQTCLWGYFIPACLNDQINIKPYIIYNCICGDFILHSLTSSVYRMTCFIKQDGNK